MSVLLSGDTLTCVTPVYCHTDVVIIMLLNKKMIVEEKNSFNIDTIYNAN